MSDNEMVNGRLATQYIFNWRLTVVVWHYKPGIPVLDVKPLATAAEQG